MRRLCVIANRVDIKQNIMDTEITGIKRVVSKGAIRPDGEGLTLKFNIILYKVEGGK